MPLPAVNTVTEAEYLEFEATAEGRHEYVGGEIFAMTGTTLTHNELVYRAVTDLRGKLAGRQCRTWMIDVKLKVDRTGDYYYPDAFVTCDERDRGETLVQRHPTLILEVLSPSTAIYDREGKFAAYRKIESLRAYVLVSTEMQLVEVYERQEGPFWRFSAYGAGEVARVEALSVELAVDALYADLEIPVETPKRAGRLAAGEG